MSLQYDASGKLIDGVTLIGSYVVDNGVDKVTGFIATENQLNDSFGGIGRVPKNARSLNSIGDPGIWLGASVDYVYNGTNWDMQRSIAGSGGIQATPTSGSQSVAITTIATTAVKASAGVVGSISNAGNAITGIVTVYDSLSAAGKKIWAGTLAAGQVLSLGIPCGTGITITTAAADTLAVSYA